MEAYAMRVDYRLCGKPRFVLPDSQEPFMRVPDVIKRCVAFIGISLGGGKTQYVGTGFLVRIPSAVLPNMHYQYLVTARHVVSDLDGLDVFIQHVSKSGDPIQIEAAGLKWVFHQDNDVDIAVIPVGQFDDDIDTACVDESAFMREGMFEKEGIGIGDEVAVVGLFTRLKENIDPLVRIGNLAMLPKGKVISAEIQAGKFVPMEGYLIDQRSLGGMSGCPVFVRRTGNLRIRNSDGQDGVLNGLTSSYLLGVMHGHWKIDPKEANDVFPNKGDFPIGLSIVVPAERILETLNSPTLKSDRDEAEARLEIEENERLTKR